MDLMDYAIKGDLASLENKLKNSSIKLINEKESGLWLSALAYSVLSVEVGAVELLLKYGADANSVDKKGKTPLFYIGEKRPVEHDSIARRLKIAQLLLTYNSDVSICDIIGNQALFYVVFHVKGNQENLPMVELLLRHGANPRHKNAAGNSPLDFARKINDKNLIDLLNKCY